MINEEEIIKNALKILGDCTIFEIKRLFPGLNENEISAILTKWQLDGTAIAQERTCGVKKEVTIAYSLAKEIVPMPVSPSLLEKLTLLIQTMPEVEEKVKELENVNKSHELVAEKINGLCASIILLRQDIPKLTDKIKELEDKIASLNKPKLKRKRIRKAPVIIQQLPQPVVSHEEPPVTATIMLEAAKLFKEASTQLKPTATAPIAETTDPDEALLQAMEELKGDESNVK